MVMFAVFISSIVSFMREDLLLPERKEALFLLLLKIDDNHLVT